MRFHMVFRPNSSLIALSFVSDENPKNQLPILILNVILFYYLSGITLTLFSLHSYDSLCQRGSDLVLVIRLIQLYFNLSLNLQILRDIYFNKVSTNYRFSEVQVLHLLPNESDSTYCSAGILEPLMHRFVALTIAILIQALMKPITTE